MDNLKHIIIDTFLITGLIFLGIFSSGLTIVFMLLGILLGILLLPFYCIWYFISQKVLKKDKY
jgi:hypothetical protein